MQGSVTFVQPLHDLKREGKGTIRFGNRPARAPIPSDPSCISVFDHPSPRCSRVILVACVDLGTMHPFTRLSRHPLDTRSQANDLVRQCGVLTANTDRAVWVPVPDIGVGRTGCLGPPLLLKCPGGSPAHSSPVDGSPTRGSAVPNLGRHQGVPPTLGDKSLRSSPALPSSGLPTCARPKPQLPPMALRQESLRLP